MSLSNFDAFVGPAYSYSSLPIDCQECINLECIKVGSTASPYKNVLVSTAGTRRLKFRINGKGDPVDELPTNSAKKSRIRGLHKCSYNFKGESEDGFVVVGTDTVWRMHKPENGVADIYRIGIISEGRSRVSMVDFGYMGEGTDNYVLIADGVTLYMVNMETGKLSSLGNVPPERPSCLTTLCNRVYMCGTLMETGGRSQYFYYCEDSDPTKWNYTDSMQANTFSDPILSIKTVGNYLWVIGSETYEIWQGTDNYRAPVQKVNGVDTGVGTCSADSVVANAAAVFFLGGGRNGRSRVYMGDSSGTIKVISTDAMSDEFMRYDSLDDAVGFSWSEGSNIYYGLTFPTRDVTWVYNIRSGHWHKRVSTVNSISHKWSVDVVENAFNIVIGGSIDGARLYVVSNDIYDEDGETIVRKRIAPHLRSNGKALSHDSFELDLECGNALPNGYGSDPQVMLRPLDNGGRTPRESRWKSSGTMGMYRRRVKWYRLGTAVDRCYEVTMSDPIKWTLYGATISTSEGIGGV